MANKGIVIAAIVLFLWKPICVFTNVKLLAVLPEAVSFIAEAHGKIYRSDLGLIVEKLL
jgi:hypothetical protein